VEERRRKVHLEGGRIRRGCVLREFLTTKKSLSKQMIKITAHRSEEVVKRNRREEDLSSRKNEPSSKVITIKR